MNFLIKKRDNIFNYWKPDPEDQLRNTEFLSFQGKILRFLAPNRVQMFAVFAPGATISYFDHRNLKQHTSKSEIAVEVFNDNFSHPEKMMKGIDPEKDYVLNTLTGIPVTVEQLMEEAEKQKKIALEYEKFLNDKKNPLKVDGIADSIPAQQGN
jgi:hypothetical protein